MGEKREYSCFYWCISGMRVLRFMKNSTVKISLQEFDFLRAYIDVESPTFANAYQSALKAGYSKFYARVIRRHYPILRMKWLKNALKDEGLMRMIEATRHLDFGTPIPSVDRMKRIISKRERELTGGMSAKEITRALDELFGESM